mmetsp:Transcript_2997/g.10763  ORF Transcript_2997/g.10763 Transcript_2997/m.10763 type:complete len:293 (-) Transcript_2997:26-904(-)
MSSVCFVFGLGGSNGHVSTAIRASTMSFCMLGCENSLSSTMPCTSSVSSILPPGLPSTLMWSKLTSLRSRSATLSTACTAISAILRLCRFTILDDSVVMAVSTSGDVSSAENGTVVLISASFATHISAALSKPSATRIGCRPRSSRCSACSSSAPASTTTPVVPSPISSSWLLDSSTIRRATWCSTSIFSKMVAPSFVIVTSPSGDTSILSMPRGPRLERRMDVTARAAMMFDFCASRPRNRDLADCSRRMMNGRPYSSKVSDMASLYLYRRTSLGAGLGRGSPARGPIQIE